MWYYASANVSFPPAFKQRADVPKTIVSSARRSQIKKTGTNKLELLSSFLPFTTFPLENMPLVSLDSTKKKCWVAWGKRHENTELPMATENDAFSTISKHIGLWWNDYVRSSSNVSYPPQEINYVAYTALALMAVPWALCKAGKVRYWVVHPQTLPHHFYGGSRLTLAYVLYLTIWRGGGSGKWNVGMILIQNLASISQ